MTDNAQPTTEAGRRAIEGFIVADYEDGPLYEDGQRGLILAIEAEARAESAAKVRALYPWLRHKVWCNCKTDDAPDAKRCKCSLRAALDADAPAEPHQPGVEPHGATVEPSLRDVLPLLRDILDHLTLSDEYHPQPCSCAKRLLALLSGIPLAGGDIAAVLAALDADAPAEPWREASRRLHAAGDDEDGPDSKDLRVAAQRYLDSIEAWEHSDSLDADDGLLERAVGEATSALRAALAPEPRSAEPEGLDAETLAWEMHLTQRWCDGTESVTWRTDTVDEERRIAVPWHREDAEALLARLRGEQR